MYKQVDKKQTILDFVSGGIKEDNYEDYSIIDFGEYCLSLLDEYMLKDLFNLISDENCLLFKEIENKEEDND